MPQFPLWGLSSHSELDALKALWVEVCGERALPNRRDFDLDVMKRWAPHVSVAVVTPDGRFQFRLFGTELANVYGRDLTGCFLDELTPDDLWLVVILHYQEVVRTRQPLFAPISVTNGRWYTEVSRLLPTRISPCIIFSYRMLACIHIYCSIIPVVEQLFPNCSVSTAGP
jgi:hypothetical protein